MTIEILKKGKKPLEATKRKKYYCICSKCETFFSFEKTDLTKRIGFLSDGTYFELRCENCYAILWPLDFYWIRYIIMWFKYRKFMK